MEMASLLPLSVGPRGTATFCFVEGARNGVDVFLVAFDDLVLFMAKCASVETRAFFLCRDDRDVGHRRQGLSEVLLAEVIFLMVFALAGDSTINEVAAKFKSSAAKPSEKRSSTDQVFHAARQGGISCPVG